MMLKRMAILQSAKKIVVHSGAKEFVITGYDNPNGMGLILANGSSNRSGQWLDNANSEVMTDVEELNATYARNLIAELTPKMFSCSRKPAERLVGFLADEVPYPLQTNDGVSLSPMEIVAALTKMVQDMDVKMQTMQSKIDYLNDHQEWIIDKLEEYYDFGMGELDRLNDINDDFEQRISDLEDNDQPQ